VVYSTYTFEGVNGKFLKDREFEIEVTGERYPIELRLDGFYNANNSRMQG
jgi:hypothetical protein